MPEDNNTQTDPKTTETDAPAAASVEVDLLELSKNIANININQTNMNTNQAAMCKVLTDMSVRLESLEQQKNRIKIINTQPEKQLTKQEREAKEHADFFKL